MNAVAYIKEHPWTVAAIVGAAIVLYLVASSGSSGAAAAPAQNTDPSLQIAALQLQGQAQALNEKLAEANINAGVQLGVAKLQADLGMYNTSASRDVSLAGIQAQEDIQLAGLNSQTIIAQITADTNQAQIAASQNIALATAATYAHISDTQAATIIASYNAQVAQAQIAGDTQLGIVNAQQKTARQGSTNSLISGLVGAAALFFSDGDLKVDIQTIGFDKKNRRIVQFRYRDDPERRLHVGVIAQEIMKSDPQAVIRDPASGYLRVNYGALN